MDDFCTDSQDFFFLLLLADSEVRGRVSNCPPFLTVFFFLHSTENWDYYYFFYLFFNKKILQNTV